MFFRLSVYKLQLSISHGAKGGYVEHLTLQIARKNWKLYFYWKCYCIFLIWACRGFYAVIGWKSGVGGIHLPWNCVLSSSILCWCMFLNHDVCIRRAQGVSVLGLDCLLCCVCVDLQFITCPCLEIVFRTYTCAVHPEAKVQIGYFEQTRHCLWEYIIFPEK